MRKLTVNDGMLSIDVQDSNNIQITKTDGTEQHIRLTLSQVQFVFQAIQLADYPVAGQYQSDRV